jgi:predicted O-methyltransferase YrrM
MNPLERLIESRPQFHGWPDGRVADWSLSADALRHLRACLEPGMRTLETGAGASTVVFAISSTRHVCITPDRAEAERINAYCAREGIAHDITFIHEPSERALPASTLVPERLDFVLIDGAHRFPLPMLDWHYTEARVPPAGVIAVDDICRRSGFSTISSSERMNGRSPGPSARRRFFVASGPRCC